MTRYRVRKQLTVSVNKVARVYIALDPRLVFHPNKILSVSLYSILHLQIEIIRSFEIESESLVALS